MIQEDETEQEEIPELGLEELYFLSVYEEIDGLRKVKITKGSAGEFAEIESIGVREIEFYIETHPDEIDDPWYFSQVILAIERLKLRHGFR